MTNPGAPIDSPYHTCVCVRGWVEGGYAALKCIAACALMLHLGCQEAALLGGHDAGNRGR